MGWVNDARAELVAGRSVQVRPFGGSMRGRIESGQFVTLAPVSPVDVRVDDVVLVEWRGNYLLHLVKEVQGDQLLIGNNLGKVNGWVASTAVIGKVVGDTASGRPSERHPCRGYPDGAVLACCTTPGPGSVPNSCRTQRFWRSSRNGNCSDA